MSASQASGSASASVSEWWLDGSALPELVWARLLQGQDGFTIQDSDGRLHIFDRLDDAIAWLSEDEYERLTELQADGRVPLDVVPLTLDPTASATTRAPAADR